MQKLYHDPIFIKKYIFICIKCILGFPDSSIGKESTCNAGHPGSISRSGRSSGEGKSYLLQYSWASLVARLKNLPAMWETWIRSLAWEDPLEKVKVKSRSRVQLFETAWTVACQPSIHVIFQEGELERVVIFFSRGSSPPKDQTRVSCIAGRLFTV